MKFNCNEIEISDEEFGCEVSFYEKKQERHADREISIDKIIASVGQYLLLQRTYPEDDFEDDYYYVEMSDFDKCGELDEFTIDLNKNLFVLIYKNEIFEIGIKLNDDKYETLKAVLQKIANKKGQLIIKE
jgi:hypothetical protein